MVSENSIELRIDGPPRGKERPRLGRGRIYTPQQTMLAEARIRDAWTEHGRRRIDGAVVLDVTVVLERPQAHYRVSGALAAAGERAPHPTRKPDLDNVIKLCADALNKLAYRDDADIVHAWAVKRWANPGETEHTIIRVRPMANPLRAVAA